MIYYQINHSRLLKPTIVFMDLAADFSYKLSSELIMPPSFPSLIYNIDHHMEEKNN